MIFMGSPEEHRGFKDFANSCKPSLNEAWKALKSAGHYPEFESPKQWFDWCWAQPEAEDIHKAYQ